MHPGFTDEFLVGFREKIEKHEKVGVKTTGLQTLIESISKLALWISEILSLNDSPNDVEHSIKIWCPSCERCRVFAAFEKSRHVRDTSVTQKVSVAANSGQGENRVR